MRFRNVLYIAALLVSCSREESKQEFQFLLDWQAEPTYLGIYHARSLGLFERQGLDVEIVQSWGANQAVSAVAGGTYEIATASGGATVLGYNSGADIVSLAVLYPKIPTVIYGLATEGVRTPSDLYGKKVGIYPGSITKNEFDAFVLANSLDRSRMNVISLSGPDIPLVLSDRVDAVLHYTEMSPVQVEMGSASGTPAQKTFELRLADHGVRGYGLNLVTSRAALQRSSQKIMAIRDAVLEGYSRGCADPDRAIAQFLIDFPDKNPAYVTESWTRVCQLIGTTPGAQDAAGWSATIDVYKNLDLLTRPVEPKDILP